MPNVTHKAGARRDSQLHLRVNVAKTKLMRLMIVHCEVSVCVWRIDTKGHVKHLACTIVFGKLPISSYLPVERPLGPSLWEGIMDLQSASGAFAGQSGSTSDGHDYTWNE